MKNILFIGPYRQCDGWGYAARDYIMALNETQHRISCKPVYLGRPNSAGLHPKILQTEQVQFDKPDIVIQNVLPPYLDYQYGMKNIALCYIETNHLQHTSWIGHLNLMDEIWVASEHEKRILLANGVTVPIRCVPMPIDCDTIDTYTEKWPVAHSDSSCIFYTVSEYSERKNIQALITAFYNEFYHTESAQLLLKLHKPGMTEAVLYQLLAKDILALKNELRLYKAEWGYPDILLAIQNLSMAHLTSIHRCGDCFIMPSRGESLCRPLMDAMYVGNQVIVTKHTGMDDIATGPGTYNVDSMEQAVRVKYPPLPYLYTGRETWQEISIPRLQKAMRAALCDWEAGITYDRTYIKDTYGYKAIAKTIKELL